MSKHPTAVTIDALLAHQDWLRRLAGALVRDAHEADDLVQETMLTALRSPPKADVNARHWLAVVLRNSLTALRRSSKRRDARERAAARKEALPATIEALALASIQHELVEHVLKLDEPLREVVLLRFFADMPPREIAAQLDRPLNSVKSSLQRGLAQLRVKLDAKAGGREEWLAILGPFGSALPLATATKFWIGAALLVLIAGVAWMSVRPERASSEVSVASLSDPTTVPAASTESVAGPSAPDAAGRANFDAKRVPAGVETTASATNPARPPDAVSTRARFVAVDGTPLAGFRVRIVDPQQARWSDLAETVIIAPNFWLEVSPDERSRLRASPDALEDFVTRYFGEPAIGRALILGTPVPERILVTDENGELALNFARARESFDAEDPEQYALLATGRTHHDHLAGQVTCVFAPVRALHGRVLDGDGLGLAQTQVGIEFDGAFRLDLPVGSFECSSLDKLRASTDEAGRFLIGSVPRIPIAGLTIAIRGRTVFLPRAFTVEELDAGAELAVAFPKPTQAKVEVVKPLIGRVLRADGSPARHARVADATQCVDVDLDGRFELKQPRSGRLWAFERSYGYAVFESERRSVGHAATDAGLELVLSNPLGSIEGVVLDERRLPAAGIEVSIADSTHEVKMRESIEAFLAGSRSLRVETDESGRFRIEGLLSREYTLRAVRDKQWSTPMTMAPSPSLVTIELPQVRRFERIRGRATTLDGEPLRIRSVSVVSLNDDSETRRNSSNTVHGTTTIAGAFEVLHVACSHPTLVINADGYMPGRRALAENAGESDIEVRLAPACRVHVSIPATIRADQLCVRDASNDQLEILAGPDSHVASLTRLSVTSETIPPFLVSALATEILLVRGTEIVARRSVRPDPDGITRVDF